MGNFKDLEEANKEIEQSKVVFNDNENLTDKKEDVAQEENTEEKQGEEEGSGLFTSDGKELPKIDGGYDLIEPGGTLGDDQFVSV